MTAPAKPLDAYREVAHVIRQVRLMDRFFDEVVDELEHEHRAKIYDDLHGGYMDMLNKELAPYALLLAEAIMQLEDAYPEIVRPTVRDRATSG